MFIIDSKLTLVFLNGFDVFFVSALTFFSSNFEFSNCYIFNQKIRPLLIGNRLF